MKQKKVERVERRRPQLELNLAADSKKARSAAGPDGFFRRLKRRLGLR